MDKAYSRKTKKYSLSKVFDNTVHSNIVKKIVYIQSTDILLVLEQGSQKIKFYFADPYNRPVLIDKNSSAYRFEPKNLKYEQTPELLSKETLSPPLEEKGQRSFILDFAYSEYKNMVFNFFFLSKKIYFLKKEKINY